MDKRIREMVVEPGLLHSIIQIQGEVAGLGYDLGAIMNLVAQRLRSLTDARDVVVELAEGDDMVYRAVAGPAEAQLGLRLKRLSSLSGLCVQTNQIQICKDAETDNRVDGAACVRVGMRSMVVAPLKHGDTVVGALKIGAAESDAFGNGHAQVLAMMSDLVAAAMYHATRLKSDELYHLATHDPLTGIGNRALFYDRLRQCLASVGRHPTKSAVLIVDMDGLKPINDQHGHHAGDAAIRAVAVRIRDTLRQTDTVARLGGDEFGAILAQVGGDDDARALVGRVIDNIRKPFHFNDQPLPLDASIGVAIAPDDGAEAEALVAEADRRMYDVKKSRTGLRSAR